MEENHFQLYSRKAFLTARKAALADGYKTGIKLAPEGRTVLLIAAALVLLLSIFGIYYSGSGESALVLGQEDRAAGRKANPDDLVEKQDSRTVSTTLVVYVSGAVKNPKILNLPAGARVADAIEKAGGATPEADLENINLAKKLADGEQIRIALKGEKSRGSASKLVSINTAEQAELEKLRGVGPALAQRIIDYRQQKGGFSSVEELQKVPGIGAQKFSAIRPQVQL